MPIVPISHLRLNPRNARTHSDAQIKKLTESIRAHGYVNLILTDETFEIIAGHARYEALKRLGFEEVEVRVVENLSPAKKRSLSLALNRISLDAGWDREILAKEIDDLSHLLSVEGLSISITGFDAAELDSIIVDLDEAPNEEVLPHLEPHSVSMPQETWVLDDHRVLCGDARDRDQIADFLGTERAACASQDPPYNIAARTIGGRGSIRHRDFQMANGEMSPEEYIQFLQTTLGNCAAFSQPGAVHYTACDWRHVDQVICAARGIYDRILNVAVWDKINPGQGGLYRNQYELFVVTQVSGGPYHNNVQRGKFGRNRSNVWRHAGFNAFGKDRLKELALHPTIKPTQLIMDCLKDCTKPGDVVLDVFAGAGSTILAAERTRRRAYAVEIEPRFVDVCIRRWQEFTGRDAVNLKTGQTFNDLAQERRSDVER